MTHFNKIMRQSVKKKKVNHVDVSLTEVRQERRAEIFQGYDFLAAPEL